MPEPAQQKSRTGLYIGLGVGAVVVFVGGALVVAAVVAALLMM